MNNVPVGYKVVWGPKYVNQKITESKTKDAIGKLIIAGIGAIPKIGPFIGGSITTLDIANGLTSSYDFAKIGGVYTDTYYIKRPVRPEHRGIKINVPVPHEFHFFTVIYKSSARKVGYVLGTSWKSDGIRSANI